MPTRIAMGELPRAPHTALRSQEGALRFEHCLTTRGFDGPYTILHHVAPPHLQDAIDEPPLDARPVFVEDASLRKRHYRSAQLAPSGQVSDTVALLANDDVSIGVACPTGEDTSYWIDGDHDRLVYVATGMGTLRSVFGDLSFSAGDYVVVPRGVLHRFLVAPSSRLFTVGFASALGLLARHVNEAGQLRMDAPLSNRDLRAPAFVGPLDEGMRELRVRRGGFVHRFGLRTSPLDVVGWDGSVYPFAFAIRAFRPRVGKTHLPPDVHGTFSARGALVSSFVPRPLDFGEDAIPCPYPHSSVDCDEVIFYDSGDFLSRRGIEAGSITLHPSGIPHGPIVEAYGASIGKTHVDEVAVMLDLDRPLRRTALSLVLEDPGYHASYLAGGSWERRDG